MSKYHFTTLRIISVITLSAFLAVQVAWGCEDRGHRVGVITPTRCNHIRAQAAGEGRAAGEIANALGIGGQATTANMAGDIKTDLSNFKPGDIVLHETKGLIRIVALSIEKDSLTFAPVGSPGLGVSELGYNPADGKVRYGTPTISPASIREMRLWGTEEALGLAKRRAEKKYDKDLAAFLFGYSVIQRRLKERGPLAEIYRKIISECDRGRNCNFPDLISGDYDNGVKDIRDVLKSIFVKIYEETGEDIIKTAVIESFGKKKDQRRWPMLPAAHRAASTWPDLKYVPYDIDYYYRNWLLVNGLKVWIPQEEYEKHLTRPNPNSIISLGRYYPARDIKHEQDGFTRQLLKLKEDFSVADKIVAQYQTDIAEIIPMDSIDLIVPVPSTQQDTNQVSRLVKAMSARFGRPMSLTALVKIRESGKQHEQSSAYDRMVNVAMAFRGQESELQGKTILIVDDIVTTGSTLWEAQRAAYEVGAKKVMLFAFGKTAISYPSIFTTDSAAHAAGEAVAAATGVFKEGDRVSHIKFGVGRILKIAQQKFADAEVPVYKIEFPAGEKQIAVFPGTQSPLSLVESEKAEEQPQINHGMADEIEKAINEITEEAYRRLDAIREEQGRHFVGEWLIPKLNTNKDKLKAALRELPPEQYSAAISRLRQLESRAHLFFLVAIYNISDILKFIQIDAASGRFVAADKDFQYFLDNFTTNYHNLSPAEILGLLKFQPAVPLVVPVLWQLLARGNIKDLVWEAASHERRELEGKGIQPIRLANLNDPATVRMVLEEVRQQRYLEKTLHGDILRATGHRIKQFDDKPELLDIYADEIAQVLGISLEKRKKDFAGSVKKAEQVQGYLNRLIYRRGKGIEFQLSPRNLEELRYGDLCGDCTASFSKEHTGVAVNFWTVPVWIGCQTHFILTEYRDGQFYAKYNIAVMTGLSGEPVLYVHATEVSSKASAGSEIFKDQGIREEMLQSGIAKIFEIAREANIRTVYFLPLSNTDWVEQIMEDRLQTIEDVMLSKFGGADLTARFCERHSSSTPAIRGIYIQGFEGATDDTAVIGSLLTEQVVDPERIKAVILQYGPEAEQGKVNAVVNLVLSHKRKIDVSDDIRIIDLYGELIDNVHEAESDYCKMKGQEFLSKQIKKEGISLDEYDILDTVNDLFDKIYGIPIGQLNEKGKIEDETIARLEEIGLEHGQAVRFVESASYIYRIEIYALLPFADEEISYEEARNRCIEQGLSSEEATGLLDGMASYLKEATGVDILGSEAPTAGAATRAGGEPVSANAAAAIMTLERLQQHPELNELIIVIGDSGLADSLSQRGFEAIGVDTEAQAAGLRADYEQRAYFVLIINKLAIPNTLQLSNFPPVEFTSSNALGESLADLLGQDV